MAIDLLNMTFLPLATCTMLCYAMLNAGVALNGTCLTKVAI